MRSILFFLLGAPIPIIILIALSVIVDLTDSKIAPGGIVPAPSSAIDHALCLILREIYAPLGPATSIENFRTGSTRTSIRTGNKDHTAWMNNPIYLAHHIIRTWPVGWKGIPGSIAGAMAKWERVTDSMSGVIHNRPPAPRWRWIAALALGERAMRCLKRRGRSRWRGGAETGRVARRARTSGQSQQFPVNIHLNGNVRTNDLPHIRPLGRDVYEVGHSPIPDPPVRSRVDMVGCVTRQH